MKSIGRGASEEIAFENLAEMKLKREPPLRKGNDAKEAFNPVQMSHTMMAKLPTHNGTMQ